VNIQRERERVFQERRRPGRARAEVRGSAERVAPAIPLTPTLLRPPPTKKPRPPLGDRGFFYLHPHQLRGISSGSPDKFE